MTKETNRQNLSAGKGTDSTVRKLAFIADKFRRKAEVFSTWQDGVVIVQLLSCIL